MFALECNEDGEGRTTKRKTKKRKDVGKSKKVGKKKLAVGDTVEVRHFDKGLRGSWSTGVVIKSEKSVRQVEYADLLCDDGSSKLIEVICVSPAVDGMPSSRTTKSVRGNIRPSPPCLHIESPKLFYGLCVDALINHDWWEGVIFDHEEGAGKRLIFFPDEGDQVMVDVDQLRVAQDWDEGSGEWKNRGEWLFLGFLRNTKQWGLFPVSTRQIWYDLRANVAKYIDLDWTCRNESLWEELVLKAIEENALAAKGRICSFSDYFPKKYSAALKSSEKTSKLFVAASSVCSGGQMDESNLHVFDERDKAKENLAPGRSKRSKTLVPRNFASTSVPELPAEEPFTCSEDLCIDQGKVSHPILVSQCGMDATTFEHGFQVGSMDVIDGQMGGYQKILSAPTGWCHADNLAPGKHLANAEHKTRKTCIIQSSTSTLVSGDEMVDHVIHQRLQNTNECVAQKNHLCHDILKLPSEPNATVRKTNIQDSGLHSCSSLFNNGLSPSNQAMLSFQSDLGSCLPSCPEAFPESQSFNCGDNVDGKCCTYLKEQEVNGQSSGNADGSMASYSSCKYDASHLSMTNSGPACLIKESVENARVTGTSLYKQEHSSWTAEVVLSNADAKAHGIHQGTGQSFTQLTGSDGLLDSDIQAILLPEILDKQQDAEDGRCLVEANRACGSLKPEIALDFGSEYCPEAVMDYYYNCTPTGICKQNGLSEDTKKIRLKAKKHLSADGWTFWYVDKGNKRRLRCGQPNGGCFYSLRTACKAWIDANVIIRRPTVSPTWEVTVSKRSKGPSVDEKDVNFVKSASTCFKLKRSTQPSNDWPGPGWSLLNRPRSGSGKITGARKCRRRRNFHSDSTVSQCLPCEMNAHLLSWPAISENVKPSGLPMLCGKTVGHLPYRSSGSRKRRKHKSSAAIIRYRRSNIRSLTCVLRSSKRAPQAFVSSSQPRIQTIFSWLIDNEVVLPRQKVCYMHGKDRRVMAKGQITRGGIKCKCCKKVFSLTGFKLHAGSKNNRPAAHIFLEDGRSLLECQIKLLNCEKLKGLGSDTGARMKRDFHDCKTDNICSICNYGGKLVLKFLKEVGPAQLANVAYVARVILMATVNSSQQKLFFIVISASVNVGLKEHCLFLYSNSIC
ncbi:hypothetical protein ACLOJK_036833 [Asimina triloba]